MNDRIRPTPQKTEIPLGIKTSYSDDPLNLTIGIMRCVGVAVVVVAAGAVSPSPVGMFSSFPQPMIVKKKVRTISPQRTSRISQTPL